MGRRIALGLLLLALLLAACGGGKKSTPTVQGTVQPAAVALTVRGAASVTFKSSTPLQIVVSDAPSIPANLRFLSVAFTRPESAPAGKFRAGLNVFGYSGDGRIRIPAVAPGKAAGGLSTIAYFDLTGAGGVADRFQRPALDCTVQISQRGFEGSVDCPALQDDKGKSVTLHLSWKA
ncbi:MAG: hypothetical protein ABR548_03070 [Actinomycetota bacterium]|nr:hypothetical protein [Actinomycetota bacterium]